MKRRGATERDEPNGPLVVLVESGKTNAKRAWELARVLGYRAHIVDSVEEAAGVVARSDPPDIVLAGLPGAEAVVRVAVARGENRPSVIVALSSPGEGSERCEELGADGWVVRPYKRDTLAAVLRTATLLRGARRRAAEAEAALATERARFGEVDPATGFYPFELFKKLLVMEMKRARRYAYPLAACLVAIDGPAGDEVAAEVARALRPAIRDIDLPVDYAGGRFLVFLPYTDLAGASRVGRRLESAARRAGHVVSVGIAALRQAGPPSFARLIRDASIALRAAQLKGGGQVVVRQHA